MRTICIMCGMMLVVGMAFAQMPPGGGGGGGGGGGQQWTAPPPISLPALEDATVEASHQFSVPMVATDWDTPAGGGQQEGQMVVCEGNSIASCYQGMWQIPPGTYAPAQARTEFSFSGTARGPRAENLTVSDTFRFHNAPGGDPARGDALAYKTRYVLITANCGTVAVVVLVNEGQPVGTVNLLQDPIPRQCELRLVPAGDGSFSPSGADATTFYFRPTPPGMYELEVTLGQDTVAVGPIPVTAGVTTAVELTITPPPQHA